MSGHSKWHSIRHQKAKADKKRGKVFSKLSKAIAVAAREGGGDPEMNFTLRLAIDKAKDANMPKDNIERAIARGTGADTDEAQLERAVYDGMGPGNAAIVIETLTDNTNRTLSSLRKIFNKHNGNLDAQVVWMFERKGVVRVHDASGAEDRDGFEMALIEAGAQELDWNSENGGLEVVSAIEDLQSVEKAVKEAELKVNEAGLEYVAKNEVELSADEEEKLENFIEAIDDDEDVENVFVNAK